MTHVYIVKGLPHSLRNISTALHEYVSPTMYPPLATTVHSLSLLNEVDFGGLHVRASSIFLCACFILLGICFPGTSMSAQTMRFHFLILNTISFMHICHNYLLKTYFKIHIWQCVYLSVQGELSVYGYHL